MSSPVPFTRVFNEGWMNYDLVSREIIEYTINLTAEQIESIERDRFAEYRRKAVHDSLLFVGDNPAVMLSGGIDSQVMLYSFIETGIKVSPVIVDFDGKNTHDTDVALEYCKLLNVDPTVIELNVKWFLNREGVQYGLKHGLRSPQFTCHAKACELLQAKGYTGAVFGGNSLYLIKNHLDVSEGWIFGASAAQLLDLPTFSQSINWPIIGSFCSWSWQACMAMSALSEENVDDAETRYQQKIQAYRSFGIPIIPQKQKYTGFENIKNEIDAMDKAGYFELKFRAPLYAKTPDQYKPRLILTDAQQQALDNLSARLKT